MDPEYKARYRELYQRHWWWRAREDLIVETLHSIRPADGWNAILDVGCGDGLLFDRLAPLGDVEGVEPDGSLVSPQGRWAGRIHVGPFDAFEPARRYGLILLLDVLEHLVDATACLRHARELLAPGGTVLVTVPAFRALWTRHDDLNRHRTRYTQRSLARVAGAAGVEVRTARYFFQWMVPAKLAVRLAERVLPSPSTLPQVPPRWLNEALYRFSRLEQRTLGALPVPFGSSLLAICRSP